MRLIDADALLERINYKTKSGLGKTIAFTFKHFIDDAPTIEAHGDLISRADAIETVKKQFLQSLDIPVCKEIRQAFVGAITAIPSAEYSKPPQTTLNCDLVSRADAIESVCGVVIDEFNISPTSGYEVAEKALSALPSAEAEWIPREHFDVLKKNYDMLAGLLEEAKARAIGAWIPVSERLPSEDGRYLVTYPLLRWQNNWINLMHYGKPSMPNCEVKGKCFYVSDDEWGDVVYDNIIAWMPLPKPYREDGE